MGALRPAEDRDRAARRVHPRPHIPAHAPVVAPPASSCLSLSCHRGYALLVAAYRHRHRHQSSTSAITSPGADWRVGAPEAKCTAERAGVSVLRRRGG